MTNAPINRSRLEELRRDLIESVNKSDIKLAAIQDIGSQKREKLEETDMEIAQRISSREIILKDKINNQHELWIENDHFAGYVIEIDGKGYEFVRSIKTPYIVQ